jgi:hypothetical protein
MLGWAPPSAAGRASEAPVVAGDGADRVELLEVRRLPPV